MGYIYICAMELGWIKSNQQWFPANTGTFIMRQIFERSLTCMSIGSRIKMRIKNRFNNGFHYDTTI